MTGRTDHRIKRITLDLSVGDEPTAHALLARDRGTLADRLAAPIDRVCAALGGSARVDRIDRVELDLGVLPFENFAVELPRRLEAALHAALSKVLGAGSTAPATDPALDLLEIFARTGNLPWTADPSREEPVAAALRLALDATPRALTGLLRDLADDPRALARLARHSDDATRRDVLALTRAADLDPDLTRDMHRAFAGEHVLATRPPDDHDPAATRPTDDRDPATRPPATRSPDDPPEDPPPADRPAVARALAALRAALADPSLADLRVALADEPRELAAVLAALLAPAAPPGPPRDRTLGSAPAPAPVPDDMSAATSSPVPGDMSEAPSSHVLAASPGSPASTAAAIVAAPAADSVAPPPARAATIAARAAGSVAPPHARADDGLDLAAVLAALADLRGRPPAPGPDDMSGAPSPQPLERIDASEALDAALLALAALLAPDAPPGPPPGPTPGPAPAAATSPVPGDMSAATAPPVPGDMSEAPSSPVHTDSPGSPASRPADRVTAPAAGSVAPAPAHPGEPPTPAASRALAAVQALRRLLPAPAPVPEDSPRAQTPAASPPPAIAPSRPRAPPRAVVRARSEALARLDELYVEDAGLVLLWPFYERLFRRVGLTDDERRFVDEPARIQAVVLLELLATADPEPPEYRLPLAKVLCGVPLTGDFAPRLPLAPELHDECARLLAAVRDHVPDLGDIAPDGLRAAFLRRRAALRVRDGSWLLQVERQPHDLLLERFPWSWSWVKLAWMPDPMRVEW